MDTDGHGTLSVSGICKHAARLIASKQPDLRMRGVWQFELVFQPTPTERCFHYQVILALADGFGTCFVPSFIDHRPSSGMVGIPVKRLLSRNGLLPPYRLAVADAVLSTLGARPSEKFEVTADPTAKFQWRNDIVVKEVLRQLGRDTLKNRIPRVLNIGAVGGLIAGLLNSGVEVVATDLDDSLLGHSLGGVSVEGAARNRTYLTSCDLVLVTGMAVANGTLPSILRLAHRQNTKVVIFAETGASLGGLYCRQGADVVIGEPFPFYIFPGSSTINIWRSEDVAETGR